MKSNVLSSRQVDCARVLRLRHGQAAVRAMPGRQLRRRASAVVETSSAADQLLLSNGAVLSSATTGAPEGLVASNNVARPASAFLELGVDPLIAACLPSLDVLRPSPIQAAALPAILSGHNCAVQSYTGSGKTLSYLLPVMTLALRNAEEAEADPATPRRGGVPNVPIQALVVAPSQELAMQIVRVARSLLPQQLKRAAAGAGGGGLVQQVIGGANPKRQAEALSGVPGPLVVVGTPGRLAEMVRTGSLKLHQCPILVIDEADQLLSSAFSEDMNYINDHCGKRAPPTTSTSSSSSSLDSSASSTSYTSSAAASYAPAALRRQTVLVSATLTPSVLTRSSAWCPDPRFISAGAVPALVAAGAAAGGSETAEKPVWGWGVRGWDGPASPLAPKTHGSAGGVEGDDLIPTMPPQLQHHYIVAEPRHKVDTLRRAMHALGSQRVLVFMNFQQRLQDAQFKLQARGIKAASLHGELPRLVRANLLNDFRRGRLRALLVSDVAARGIDVPACDAVFHLELPSSAAHYAHRAGRTGRLSAALAAQTAAEAAAVAAEAKVAAEKDAEEEGAEAGSGGRGARENRQATAVMREALMTVEQAVGTVITIVAPNERFVVDKLAEQLGVPLLEAHVSHGELRPGAPPAGYTFERDHDSDKADPGKEGGEAVGGGKKARRERKSGGAEVQGGRGSEAEDEAEGAPAKRDAGAEASTSGRSSSAAAVAKTNAKSKTKTKSSTTAQAKQSAAAGQDSSSSAGDSKDENKRGKKGDTDKYEVIVDEDDDILDDDEYDNSGGADFEDYEVLDEDLAAFKSLRPAQVRQLGAAAAAAAAGQGAAANAAAAAGIKLKGQRKQRVVLPDMVGPSSSSGGSGGAGGVRNGDVGSSGKRVTSKALKGRGRKGQLGEEQPPRAKSRSTVLEELQRELEEIRAEKEKAKQQGRSRK